MSERPLWILHYVNQFFGGLGVEVKADQAPELRDGPVGPGILRACAGP